MGVNAKTEVLELIVAHIDLKDSEDLASSSKYHLQVLRLSLQQSARRLRCVNSWALLGWDAEKLIVILSHQMKSQCLAISDAYF
ncbi:unnamed protein product [Sphagnum troendelagicum]|uniref:Uncharacterized protein n=1 Tax=Sphagnum jensenii TaxID=128206 RepID=A0ABP0VYX4_9BRYO